MHTILLVCVQLHWFVQSFTGLCTTVLVCAALHWFVLTIILVCTLNDQWEMEQEARLIGAQEHPVLIPFDCENER